MLLGTYQEFPYNSDKKMCKISEVPRKIYKEINMAPVWAFPLNSMADAFIHSSFTAPNIPQLFYIFETDNYIRFDKIKHYQNIKNKIDTLSDCIDENIEDKYSEFVVTPEELEKSIKLTFCVTGVVPFLNGEDISCIVTKSVAIEKDLQKYLRDICMGLGPVNELLNAKWDLNNEDDFRRYNEYNRIVFEAVFLPMAYLFIAEGKFDFRYALACNHNHLSIVRTRNNFALYSYNDCSKEMYDRLYEEMGRYLVTDPKLLELIAKNEIPSRNDLCPCGSGIKFKKCCGKYWK